MSNQTLIQMIEAQRSQSPGLPLLVSSMQQLLQNIEDLLKQQEALRAQIERQWKRFGEDARELRHQRNLSLTELGDKLGISKSALHYLETCERSWDVPFAQKMIKELTQR